jgi:hypothetical protein
MAGGKHYQISKFNQISKLKNEVLMTERQQQFLDRAVSLPFQFW